MPTGRQNSDGFPNLTSKGSPVDADIVMVADSAASNSPKQSTVGSLPFVSLAGDTMSGLLILSGDPVTGLGAVTKNYADAISAGLNVKAPVRMAGTTALTVTYANGASGVGATLTNAGTQVALTLDGVAAVVADRVLIKNQASTFQNGIYTVTNIGSGATNWVLTRATDYDQVAEIFPGNLVITTAGTTQSNTSWLQTATVATIGTDPITFIQFSSTPLTLPLSVTQGGTGVSTLTTAYGTLAAGTTATGNVQTVATGTTGQVLVSAGNAALPAYGTAPVAGGGTGVATLTTAYGTLVAGTTATGPVQTVSPGTTGQALVSAGAASVPAYGTLPATGGGTGVVSPTAHGIMVAEGASAMTPIVLTNGQILIGSTGADPVAGVPTVTGGTWTVGAGTVTLAITGGGMVWTDVTGTTQAAAINNGYIADNVGLVTVTLPTVAAIGSIIKIAGKGAGGWKVAQNASQFINYGSAAATTTGTSGSLASSNQWDQVELICVTANNGWVVANSVGNITIV